ELAGAAGHGHGGGGPALAADLAEGVGHGVAVGGQAAGDQAGQLRHLARFDPQARGQDGRFRRMGGGQGGVTHSSASSFQDKGMMPAHSGKRPPGANVAVPGQACAVPEGEA
ncbi:hypothetical protein HMPREF0731_2069, partial [Pseudoroseomonas cervicalis ATCC 49957]